MQVGGATFTFVDLPGIQQLPSADHDASRALVSSYLQDNNQDTLVLCVIDATTAGDLERSAALKEIIAANKMSNTILALTKCDEVQDVDSILAKIFDVLEDLNGANNKIPGMPGGMTHCCIHIILHGQSKKSVPFCSVLNLDARMTAD